jgi:hypothetical protein
MVTLLSIPGGLFLLAAGLACLTGAAIFCAILAARWHDQKRFWQSLAVSIPLGIATAGVLWVGHQNWYLNSSGNFGFGPDWQCTIPKTGAEVCIRNVQKPPATQPNARGESR